MPGSTPSIRMTTVPPTPPAPASHAQLDRLTRHVHSDGRTATHTHNEHSATTAHGSDWYFERLASGSGAGQGMDSFVSQTTAGGAQPDLTVDIMPYAAKLD